MDYRKQTKVQLISEIEALKAEVEALRKGQPEAGERRFAALVQHSSDMIGILGADATIQYASPSAEPLLGYPAEELMGRNAFDLIHPDEHLEARGILEQVLASPGRLLRLVLRLRHRLGSWRTFEITGRNLLHDPMVRGIVTNARDVTEQVEMARALHSSEARLQRLVEANIVGVVFGGEEVITEANGAFLDLLGYSRDDLRAGALRWTKLTPPEYTELDQRGVRQLLATGICQPFEKEYFHRDGTRIPVLIGAALLQREPMEWVAFVVDLTQRKAAERERQQREEQLRLITEALPVLVSYVDHEQRYRFNNLAYETWFGHSRAEITGKHIREVLGESAYETVLPQIEAALRGETITYETAVLYRDAGLRHIHGSYVPHRDETGRVLGYIALISDVSEQKRIEAQLREQRETVETINRMGQLLSAELDTQRLVQAVTDAATSLTGAQFGAFFYNVMNERGESYMLYTLSGVPREAFEGFPMPRNTAIFSPTFRGERTVRYDDVRQVPGFAQNSPYKGMPVGHLPVVSYLAVPVIGRSGETLGGIFLAHAESGVFSERDERVVEGLAAQAAIAMDNARLYEEAQRAISLREQFLVVASHELKTPLTTVKGYTELLLRRASRGEGLDERILRTAQVIHTETLRLQQLVDLLLDFSRLQAGTLRLEREPLDLLALVQRLVETTQPTVPKHTLEVASLAAPVVIYGDTLRLEQVLRNLLGNAIKYSPDGGAITIRVGLQGVGARIAISDQGLGIPDADLPHLFEQFYRASHSTAQGIGGMGLGLYIVRHLVEAHGGTIQVSSTVGEGATFTIELPVA